MRKTITGVFIKENKILLVKKNYHWMIPGGKPNEGESPLETLAREIGIEELPGTEMDLTSAQYYGHFDGISPNKRLPTRTELYIVKEFGKIGKPSAEISDADWFSYIEANNLQLTEAAIKALNSLRDKSYLA